MITMEFDEMKRIWDSQNSEPLYTFNEKALHNRILSKKEKGRHIANASELLSVVAYAIAGCFVLGMNLYQRSANIFMYVLAAWMLGSARYLLISRSRRIKQHDRFDRSMYGDLKHAIAVATYQVRLSQYMRWNILPIGILTLLGMWESGKSVWLVAAIPIFFALVYYAAGWEHRIYKSRKRELEVLQSKLETEASTDRPSH
jgi:hypothetical protein